MAVPVVDPHGTHAGRPVPHTAGPVPHAGGPIPHAYAPGILRGPMARPRRSSSSRLFRTLNYLALIPLAARAPAYVRLVLALLRDDRVGAARKGVLGLAAAYMLLPIDLVPDAIPLVGAIDDLVIGVLALEIFLEGVPHELLDEKLAELDIERSAFERDRAQVRRLAPRPLRQLAVRVPDAMRAIGSLARQSGPEGRLRH